MTTKCTISALLIFGSLAVSISAQSTAEKTFTKTFNTEGKGSLRLDLPGTIDLKMWDNPNIRFEIGISLPTGNGPMLNELANIGRYNLISKVEGDVLIITAPNLQKQLKVKGGELKENLTFVVFVPNNMQIDLVPSAAILADIKK